MRVGRVIGRRRRFLGGGMALLLAANAAAFAVIGIAAAQAPLEQPAAEQTAPSEVGEATANGARDEEARALFQAGRAAFTDGRFGDALDYFRRSHEISGRPVLLFNVGTAADRLRMNQEALAAFRSYLEALPEATNRREVEARIRVLEDAVAVEERQREEPGRAVLLAPMPEDEGRHADRGERDGSSVLETWWFWSAVALVVAGGVTVALLLSSSEEAEPLILGDNGAVAYTLRWP